MKNKTILTPQYLKKTPQMSMTLWNLTPQCQYNFFLHLKIAKKCRQNLEPLCI